MRSVQLVFNAFAIVTIPSLVMSFPRKLQNKLVKHTNDKIHLQTLILSLCCLSLKLRRWQAHRRSLVYCPQNCNKCI
jgi:hypothetical protein